MFFDLNVPVPNSRQGPAASQSKKNKGKQPQSSKPPPVLFPPGQLATIEARVDLLVHLGYAVIAFNQTVHKKVDAKTHVNVLDGLVGQLRRRDGVVYLKRLTIVIDEDSEKGFGLTNANTSLFNSYDLIALTPTTATSFSLACLTHSLPSPLTAHIISLPLTLPRLPFHLKHTLVRTAIKNGAVFEITYVGALGGEGDPALVDAGASESGANAKRNWWAAAREVSRVTKGKGIIVSSGVAVNSDLRAPRDVGNLLTLLGLPQDVAHDASTKTAKSLSLRAQTRKTYRAVLSEPRIVIPNVGDAEPSTSSAPGMAAPESSQVAVTAAQTEAPTEIPSSATELTGHKRPHDESDHQPEDGSRPQGSEMSQSKEGKGSRKKKRNK